MGLSIIGFLIFVSCTDYCISAFLDIDYYPSKNSTVVGGPQQTVAEQIPSLAAEQVPVEVVYADPIGYILFFGVVIINYLYLHPEFFLSIIPSSMYTSIFSVIRKLFSYIYINFSSFQNYIINIIKKFYK